MREVLLLVVLVMGCGEKSESDVNRTQGTGGGEQGSGNEEKQGAKERIEPLAEADVKALVETWRKAQNEGDFDGYQALYAKRMTGIKRVGARVFQYDRAGWIKDRGRMFKKKMEVGADKIEVAVSGGSAAVQLEQSFRQGRFHDLGPKQLVVIREGSGLRIAREEMLSSTVLGKPGAGGGAVSDFYFMLDGDILLERSGDESGAPVLDKEPGSASFRARLAVKKDALADPGLVAKTFTVYGADGKPCETAIERLAAVTGVTPHFGTVQEWQGANGPLGEGPVLSEAEIAVEVWDSGKQVLVGEPKACTGLFARAGTPALAFDEVEDAAAFAAALAAFRGLDEWKTTQTEFKDSGGKGHWDSANDAPGVLLVRHPKSGATWAVVRASSGSGCGQFGAELAAVFEQKGSKWVHRSAPTSQPFVALAAFDLDGDGGPEFVGERVLVDDTGNGFDQVDEFRYPDNDCPC
jgi:ketosteroid isomerase-like protein